MNPPVDSPASSFVRPWSKFGSPQLSLVVGTLWLSLVIAAARLAPAQTATLESPPPESAVRATVLGDPLFVIQTEAISNGVSPLAHWGWKPSDYIQWSSHSNRLIPVYTFGTRQAGAGVDLDSYVGAASIYRRADDLATLYGQLPRQTVNEQAEYLDQTDLYRLQLAAAAAGKKHLFLIVFDGMDWPTTRAAAIHATGRVAYESGRGTGLHFLDYDASGTTQFGWMVTSPHNDGTEVDVDRQSVLNPGGTKTGGYDPAIAGFAPWDVPTDPAYLAAAPELGGPIHAYTDSSSSASSMTAGIKTYNNAVNVDPTGLQVETIAHRLQRDGWSIGVVTSVPISHATPACTYSHNVHRDDYQDLTRDLLGLPSIAHPDTPLPGVDVLIGTGWGKNADAENAAAQGANFVPGNAYLTEPDRRAIDVDSGGRYVVVERRRGEPGDERLAAAADRAAREGHRLFGFFGVASTGHLPYRTADGDYRPSPGRSKTAESYTPADIAENPTLAEMTAAGITAIAARGKPFWMLVEAGDVDWANHDDNLDNSIGAVRSGDDAVRVVTEWVERHSDWNESLVIVTADHGHLLFLDDPKRLAELIGER